MSEWNLILVGWRLGAPRAVLGMAIAQRIAIL